MRTLSLLSDTSKPCGVESFARGLATNLGARDGMAAHATFRLTGQPGEQALLARALFNYDALIVNVPVVAWKKRLFAPLLAMARARRHRLDVVLVLHEWADLDWKRRLSYVPALRLATRILFSSPLVRAQFEADRLSRIATRRRDLFPVPPNMARPDTLPDTDVTQHIARLKANGTFVVGQFGAIYPKKQTTAVLDIAAAIKARGKPVHAIFIGDFIRGHGHDPEADFSARVTALGLDGDVTVTGYIAAPADVFAAIEACHALAYALPEGLTSRRGSVLAGLQTSTPVVVNAPTHHGEFDHHPTFTRALAMNALVLVPPSADANAFADALLSLPNQRPDTIAVNYTSAWNDVVSCIAPSAMPTSAQQPQPAHPSRPAAA